MKKWLVPEVVQTSAMDCGPAALKSLLGGFHIPVSYGRLREACQTSLDGTSIDTIESVANQLGLQAEQVMLPLDHVLLPAAKALPAIAVVTLANGLTHFVVVWSRHGAILQVMDPSAGRQWITARQFEADLYQHRTAVSANDWREFACSPDFLSCLESRIQQIGARGDRARSLVQVAIANDGWRSLAALDAGVRLSTALVKSRALRRGSEAADFLERVTRSPHSIPESYWSVTTAPPEDGEEQVFVTGAVLVRVTGKRAGYSPDEAADLEPELEAAVREKPLHPVRELLRLFRDTSLWSPALLLPAVFGASCGALIEALLFRGLFDVSTSLTLRFERLGAMAAILLFSVALLLLEFPVLAATVRLGRHLETRLRIAFLKKIPLLGDRYFQSRLTSDMAERSHATHRLRHLPNLARQVLRTICDLAVTSAGIVWLEPKTLPWVLLIAAASLLPPLLAQPVLAERDLRVRTHAAGLTRFYLDAMLGLSAIWAHGAERNVRREHNQLLGCWADAALRLQRTVVSAEAVQLLSMFGLVTALVLFHFPQGDDTGRVLLVIYWLLNIPVLGQQVAALLRQYPYYRNLSLRLLEPLGAPAEKAASPGNMTTALAAAARVEFRNVFVDVSGHRILTEVNTILEPGVHVAVVGPSGAGKSSLAGLLLGFLTATGGEILVDGEPLNPEQLRNRIAWVDPATRLWNRSLQANVGYGSSGGLESIGCAINAADLRTMLEHLPEGLQTKLGEGGALLSGGEGQRVRFARSLLRKQAGLVILDEAFRGLDREKRRELLSRARRAWPEATLLCITHDIAETLQFDRVLVVEDGRIVEDADPAALRGDRWSRFAQLYHAEEEIRSGLWSNSFWRRIRVQGGRVVEQRGASGEDETAAPYTEEIAS